MRQARTRDHAAERRPGVGGEQAPADPELHAGRLRRRDSEAHRRACAPTAAAPVGQGDARRRRRVAGGAGAARAGGRDGRPAPASGRRAPGRRGGSAAGTGRRRGRRARVRRSRTRPTAIAACERRIARRLVEEVAPPAPGGILRQRDERAAVELAAGARVRGVDDRRGPVDVRDRLCGARARQGCRARAG